MNVAAASHKTRPREAGLRFDLPLALAYLPLYVALDWATFIFPVGALYITPWNPQPALAIALMSWRGLVQAPTVLAGLLAADLLVRHGAGYPAGIASVAVLTAGYALIAHLIRSTLNGGRFHSVRDVTIFCSIVALGTAAIGLAFVATLTAIGILGESSAMRAWLRFWIGDSVGILVTAPLLFVLLGERTRAAMANLARSAEAWVQMALLCLLAGLLFHGAHEDATRFFYLLFVPLIWIAVRRGLAGAVLASLVVQVAVIGGVGRDGPLVPLLHLQALVAAFTLVGLYLGAMFDEREESEQRLRRSLRLAAAGEMAGAIAHEVNQPMTALANYGTAAEMLIERGGGDERLGEVVRRMVAEVRRAADVIQRMRDLFSQGTTRLEAVPVRDMMESARRIAAQAIGDDAIAFEAATQGGDWTVFADRVQIELVLRNLIANAVESLRQSRGGRGTIAALATRGPAGQTRFVVRDDGPGVVPGQRGRLFQPFVTGKATGMGVGLAVSRAIAEAHGGTLEAVGTAHGEFHLILPCTTDA